MNHSGPGSFQQILAAALAALFLISWGWLVSTNYQPGVTFWQMAISAVLLAVPLSLFFLSIGILISAAQQVRTTGQIDAGLSLLMFRTPRVAGILIAVFVGLFSLDVFDAGYGFWEALGAFLIHSVPAFFMAVMVALAWKREWIGFVAFLAAALFFLRFAVNDLPIILIFSGPLAGIALLFGANWLWRSELHQN